MNLAIIIGAAALGLLASSSPAHTPPRTSTPSPSSGKKNGGITLSFAKFEVAIAKSKWSLAFQFKQDKYAPLKSDAVIDALDSMPRSDSVRATLSGHERATKELLKGLTVYGGDYLYFLSDGNSLPIMIANDSGGKCLVVIAATDIIYNTLRSSSKQRAAKIIAKYTIPILRESADAFAADNLKQYAVFITYGTRDFADDSVLSLKAETVAVVASSLMIKRFGEAAITDQEFLDRSTVLLSDRDSSLEFVRARIAME